MTASPKALWVVQVYLAQQGKLIPVERRIYEDPVEAAAKADELEQAGWEVDLHKYVLEEGDGHGSKH
jgi:hypothetical protein